MKITSVFILFFAILQLHASEKSLHFVSRSAFFSRTESPLPDKKFQDREEYAFNHMMSELARVHKGVFSLPHTYEYIKSNLMPIVEAKRKIIAPHYPSREVTGDDQTLTMEAFREWFRVYPQESTDYIIYVDSFIAENSK